ncbi:glycosyltransferase family 4 protein [Sphingobacterium chungjuense]|uniref:glycosyltransferase family 4 protein n=1 Tax=Sphingobacterium chungjuense TaxID=2675553 RepID=UPI00140B4E53|nr:glycosyltransferase family 4 protein [Sphingobacterium chungjuense]
MRILFVLSEFPSYSETFIANQINDLIDNGNEVTIFSSDIGKTIDSSLFNRNDLYSRLVPAHQKTSLVSRLRRRFLKLFLDNRAYQNKDLLTMSESIDVVHCHFGDNALLFHEVYLKYGWFSKSKKICTFHGYDILPSSVAMLKDTYKPLFDSFDGFTYNTPYMKEIIDSFRIHPRKMHALPVGFDADFLTNYLRRNPNTYAHGDCLHLIYCGRLTYFKGCLMLPDIAEKLIAANVQNFILHIVGAGDQEYELRSKIEAQGLERHFTLYGALNQEKVFELMSAAHLFILPGLEEPKTARAETQGLVIQEAQFLKLPVLVSDAGGAKYGLMDGETGYVLPKGNVVAFVEKIKWFVENPDEIHSFSEKSHIFARENYNIAVLGKRLLAIYTGDH